MTTEVHARAGVREWIVLGVLALATFLLAVDGTVLSLAVPSISAALNPSATQLLWIGDIYSFALAGLLVTMGNLGDRIGRKRLLMIGAFSFGVASVVAAFAPSAEVLIGARALLGTAGATIMPSTLSILRHVFLDSRQRTVAIAVWSAMAAAGAAAGPIVGGALLEHFWWGSVFLINVPIMILVLVLGVFLIPESRNPNPGPFDLLSAGLSLVGIVSIVFAIKRGAHATFDSAFVLTALLGVVALWAFVRRQKSVKHPLIDVSLFRRREFSSAILTNLFAIFSLSGLLFLFSQYLQLVLGYSPLEAGIRQLPLTLASMASALVVGILIARLGRGQIVGSALLVSTTGLAMLAFGVDWNSQLWLSVAIALIGFGIGLALAITVDAVVTAVPPNRAGAASAVSETAYELGVALGIAILGSMHSALYRGFLPQLNLGEATTAVRESLASAALAIQSLPIEQGGPALVAAQDAFVSGMQVTAFTMAGLLLLTAIGAFIFMPSKDGTAEAEIEAEAEAETKTAPRPAN